MITGRDFPRSAGGISLLALRPAEDGLFAPTSIDGPRLRSVSDRIVVTKTSTRLASAPGRDA